MRLLTDDVVELDSGLAKARRARHYGEKRYEGTTIEENQSRAGGLGEKKTRKPAFVPPNAGEHFEWLRLKRGRWTYS